MLRAHPFPFPARQEQDRIGLHLDEVSLACSRACHAAIRELDLLREYRTRLIADVVTGKLDVREAAARLPDDVEDTESLDEADLLTDLNEVTDGEVDAAPDEAEA